MKQFEALDGAIQAIQKIHSGGGQSATANRAPGALIENIGAAHCAQIADQPVEIGIVDRYAIDIDDRLAKADR